MTFAKHRSREYRDRILPHARQHGTNDLTAWPAEAVLDSGTRHLRHNDIPVPRNGWRVITP